MGENEEKWGKFRKKSKKEEITREFTCYYRKIGYTYYSDSIHEPYLLWLGLGYYGGCVKKHYSPEQNRRLECFY